MATQFIHRITCICIDARKAELLDFITDEIDPVGGPQWLTSGLSSTGLAPASHWWFSAALEDEALLDAWYAMAGMTPPDWSTMNQGQMRVRIAQDQAELNAASQVDMNLMPNQAGWGNLHGLLTRFGLKVITPPLAG